MKKFVIAMAFVFASIQCYSQNIKFNGVPLGIGIEQFEPLLENKGYIVLESDISPIESRYMKYYGGVFAGSKVLLSVAYTPISELVQLVSASFSDYSMDVPDMTEESINRKFNEVKASLIKKYPNAKKTEWSNGKILKAYMLQTSKWQINLSIQENDGVKGLHVMYVDRDASKTAEREFEMDY